MDLMLGIIFLLALAQMQHEHGGMHMAHDMTHDAASALLMRQTSGTSMNPAAAPMPMSMHGDWMTMVHG